MSVVYCYTEVEVLAKDYIEQLEQMCFSTLESGLFKVRAELYTEWLHEQGVNVPYITDICEQWAADKSTLFTHPPNQPEGNEDAWNLICGKVTGCDGLVTYKDIFGVTSDGVVFYSLKELFVDMK